MRETLTGSGIFYDSADLSEFKIWAESNILGGATTNPVLLEKANVLDVEDHIHKMIEIVGWESVFPISVELPDADAPKEEMINLALHYQKQFPNHAVIKVPMKPDEPEKAFEIIYRLGQEGVRTNATLGLSMGQLVGAAEASRVSKASGDNYISLFWARRDEAKKQMIAGRLAALVTEQMTDAERAKVTDWLEAEIPDAALTLAMTLSYLQNHSLNTRVIVGSIRNIHQIEQAFALGADIVTIPPKLLREWMFTNRGLETVEEFNNAYRKVKDKISLG